MVKTTEVKRAIQDKVVECIGIAVKSFGYKQIGNSFNPEIDFSLSTKCAGVCSSKKVGDYKISFNLSMALENFDHFVNDTVPHEVAHMVDHLIHEGFRFDRTGRRKIHDKVFKNICKVLGGSGNTYHNYSTASCKSRKVARPHIYKCDCNEHEITNNIHNKINAGQHRICRSCKSRIVYSRPNV